MLGERHTQKKANATTVEQAAPGLKWANLRVDLSGGVRPSRPTLIFERMLLRPGIGDPGRRWPLF